jgi:hypothetical protein
MGGQSMNNRGYYLYDTKTKINRGWAETKQDAEHLLKELSNKWYYKYLKIIN